MNFRRIKFLLLKFKSMHFNLLSISVLTFLFFGFVITFSFINQYFDGANLDDGKIADIIDRDNNNAFADSLNKNKSLSPNSTLWSSSLIIEKVDEKNNPIGGATFLITPNPFTNNSNLAITDDNAEDANRTSGIVLLHNVIPRQYTISEIVAPDGYIKDVSVKTVNINTQSTSSPPTVTFEAYPLTSGSNRLEYTARFICGAITGEEGPLRPGRYNSDINIFNRQSFPISFFWKAVAASQEEEQSDSNFRIRSLGPGGSISLSCKDIQASIPAYANDTGEKFFEGIMTINVDLDSSVIGSISSSREGILGTISEEESLNVLSVDAIYTVNALKVASREIVLQLIEYSINKEHESGKIPKDIISKILSVTVPIRTNETINPDQQVRNVLMKEFSLNLEESKRLDITIRNLSLGVGALDDNHALSLQRINAYQPPTP
ncbi:MAG: prealbumin-like fold domain-containing protein [Thermoproteota archaeon]|nr:prealbumin-like fold domain-containing protein [Thermoproteota archaeon]